MFSMIIDYIGCIQLIVVYHKKSILNGRNGDGILLLGWNFDKFYKNSVQVRCRQRLFKNILCPSIGSYQPSEFSKVKVQ